MPRGNGKVKTIAFVAYPGLTLLDLVGPITAFYGLTMSLVSTSSQYRTVSVAERVEAIGSDTPMALIPDMAFEEVPDPFALIAPGGGMAALKAMGNDRLLDYLRFASHGAEIVGSVSTGAFLLAAAGLLEGRRATTHPAYGGSSRSWVPTTSTKAGSRTAGSSPRRGHRAGSTWRFTWWPG